MSNLQQILQTAVEVHQKGDLKSASALYKEVLSISPQHPEALHLLGVIAYQQKDFGIAIKLIKQAITEHSGAAPYHYNLGESYFALHHYKQAHKAYLETVNLQPFYPQAWSRIGFLRHRSGDLQGAHSAYQKALQQKPDYPAALNNLGLLLFAMGDLPDASKQFRKALSLEPDYAEACHNRAIILTQQKRVDEALSYYRKTLEIAPNLPGLRRHYIRLLQNICAWAELHESLEELTQLTVSALQQNLQPEESPFLNLTHNNDPMENQLIARSWSKKMLKEAEMEINCYEVLH